MMTRTRGLVLAVVLLFSSCAPGATPATSPKALEEGIDYRLDVRSEPRPLRIHHIRVDLGVGRWQLVAALSGDPDGAGPATGELEPPTTIAQRHGGVVLINANPWQSTLDASGKRSTNWRQGMHVEILGLAASDGKVRSAPTTQNCSVWTDPAGRVNIGSPPDPSSVREGVAGFGRLLDGGRIVPEAGGPIHPRTALGLDSQRKALHLVVVDGRQAGYSEGMPLRELAQLMRDLGCWDAANLDGGGSSIMMVRQGADWRVVNDPSTKRDGASVARPIPTALVIRRHKS